METDTENIGTNGDVAVNKRKRRFPSSETKNEANVLGAPETKFRLLDKFHLLDFSDEVLYEIFQYLDTWTLMALMNCCSRLSSFVLDHRFWNFIDLSKEPLPLGILEDVLERSHVNTVSIKLHGPPISQHLEREDKQFSQTLAKAFANCCTNLSTLELQGITIDFRCVRITDFPPTLKRLLLNTCNVRYEGEKSIFFGIEAHLTKLEHLGIENNNWFEPYYMMVFSKVPELRSLSLKGCQLLFDFVPYGSMAARFGFKKLECLDLRFTPIKDSDLQCFNAVSTLKEILLDCPKLLREAHEEQKVKKPERCPCSFYPNPEVMCAKGVPFEFPSTSSAAAAAASKSKKVSSSNSSTSNEENGASTSKMAMEHSKASPQSQQNSHSHSHPHCQRDDESSFSSCSSSPSASSTSSNDALPPLLSNSARAAAQGHIEFPTPGGNAPPFSRFLPRPDQIILLDLNNRWRNASMHDSGNREDRVEPRQEQERLEPQERQERQEPQKSLEQVQQKQDDQKDQQKVEDKQEPQSQEHHQKKEDKQAQQNQGEQQSKDDKQEQQNQGEQQKEEDKQQDQKQGEQLKEEDIQEEQNQEEQQKEEDKQEEQNQGELLKEEDKQEEQNQGEQQKEEDIQEEQKQGEQLKEEDKQEEQNQGEQQKEEDRQDEQNPEQQPNQEKQQQQLQQQRHNQQQQPQEMQQQNEQHQLRLQRSPRQPQNPRQLQNPRQQQNPRAPQSPRAPQNPRQQQQQAQPQRPQRPVIIQQIDLIEHQIINNQINNNQDNNANQPNNANHINQVLNHPLFWDMINPFGRVGPYMNFDEPAESARRYNSNRPRCSQYRRQRHRSNNNPISDRGICCFGRPRNPVEQGIIWIRIGNRPSENRFERLCVRNYRMVTDISLQHLVQCSPYLAYLDLSGTSVTQRGVNNFKEGKPDCIVRADHLYEPAEGMIVIDEC